MTKTHLSDDNKKNEEHCDKKSNLPNVIDEQLQTYLNSHPSSVIPLDLLNRLTFNITLDNCKEQLLIMKYLLNEIETDSCRTLFKYNPPLQRYTTSSTHRRKSLEEKWEDMQYTNFQQLNKDVSFILNSFTEARAELQKAGTFSCLMKVILGFAQEKRDDDNLKASSTKYKKKITRLSEQLDNEKSSFQKQLKDYSLRISKLQFDTEDFRVYENIKLRYIVNWEQTRQAQQKNQFDKDVKKLEDAISDLKHDLEIEDVAHNEIVTYVNECAEDLENQLVYWTEKYDIDIEDKEKDILKMKSMNETLSESYSNLISKYEIRQEVIDKWMVFKEKRRLELEFLKMQIRAAIKIQAWWRGVMVRRFLGPFAVLKKRKLRKRDKTRNTRARKH